MSKYDLSKLNKKLRTVFEAMDNYLESSEAWGHEIYFEDYSMTLSVSIESITSAEEAMSIAEDLVEKTRVFANNSGLIIANAQDDGVEEQENEHFGEEYVTYSTLVTITFKKRDAA